MLGGMETETTLNKQIIAEHDLPDFSQGVGIISMNLHFSS
jgi:hypothetical protein